MKILLLFAICSTTLLMLVSASSRDPQSKEQSFDLLLKNFASQFDAATLTGLTTVERLQTVLTALRVKIPQLDTSPAEDNLETALLISENPDLFDQCYDNTVMGEKVDLFMNNRKKVIQTYLNHHLDSLKDGNLKIIVKRIEGLLGSINYIGKRIVECINEAKDNGVEPTRIGLTPLAAYTLEEREQFFSNNMLENYHKHSFKGNNLSSRFWHNNCVTNIKFKPLPAAFDWRNFTLPDGRNYSVVTPVKNQNPCGSCFLFAATAALESAYMMSTLNNRTNQTVFNEQALLNCAAGDCRHGGEPEDVLQEAFYTGLTDSWQTEYIGKQEQCKNFPVVARPNSFCSSYDLRSDEVIQWVIQQKGPAAMLINAHSQDFHLLRSGYYNNCKDNTVNHAITTVGWDENWFIVKNSWGKDWGVNGYLYLRKDGKERCGFRNRIAVPTFGTD